ncbi:PspC domain-containing protein [Periweissella fabalis]|uniref:PspC domain-containing protein n=1 Tax=Periweissella fabalis TaxID=1070421 RepID=A0A7X6S3X6_9LACO|nr:PspC domain-containing protein [Periweissella fabalis]MCM0599802.1 PspC domain-containing protein [Periweissella fabalis]NKZ24392.1 PspC domain-containing protein [Periweissella fabalis]
MKQTKKLRRSNNRVVFGVLGGFAEYFGIDAKIMRLGFLIIIGLITIFSHAHFGIGTWLLIYLLATILMPAPVGSWLNIFSQLKDASREQQTSGNKRANTTKRDTSRQKTSQHKATIIVDGDILDERNSKKEK